MITWRSAAMPILAFAAGAAFALAGLALAVAIATPAAGPADTYLAEVRAAGLDVAPGHDPYVVAAGFVVCSRLADGQTVEEVTASAIRDGIAGDLYTGRDVRAVVAAATSALCPDRGGGQRAA